MLSAQSDCYKAPCTLHTYNKVFNQPDNFMFFAKVLRARLHDPSLLVHDACIVYTKVCLLHSP